MLLIPLRDGFIRFRITANQVTLFTCFLCLIYAGIIATNDSKSLFILFLPLFLLIRMALNALDGMIATATETQSAIGSVINEVCDIISDLSLFGAFTTLLPIPAEIWWLLIILSLISEFTALAVHQATGVRPYCGPFSKSDRALYLGLLAIILFTQPTNPVVFYIYSISGIALAIISIHNRLSIAEMKSPL